MTKAVCGLKVKYGAKPVASKKLAFNDKVRSSAIAHSRVQLPTSALHVFVSSANQIKLAVVDKRCLQDTRHVTKLSDCIYIGITLRTASRSAFKLVESEAGTGSSTPAAASSNQHASSVYSSSSIRTLVQDNSGWASMPSWSLDQQAVARCVGKGPTSATLPAFAAVLCWSSWLPRVSPGVYQSCLTCCFKICSAMFVELQGCVVCPAAVDICRAPVSALPGYQAQHALRQPW